MTNRMYDVGDVPVEVRETDVYGNPLPVGGPASDRLDEMGYEREERQFANNIPPGQDSLSKFLATGMLEPSPPEPEMDPEVLKQLLATLFRGAP